MPHPHPQDPLTAEEIRAAAAACKERAATLGLSLRFNTITLREPAKKALLAWQAAGSPAGSDCEPPRQAFCILQTAPGAVEAVVELGASPPVMSSWTEVPGVQPLATPDDCFLAEDIVKGDAEVQVG